MVQTAMHYPHLKMKTAGSVNAFLLQNGLGHMYKRRRAAIIRFHRFNCEKEANKMYISKLMLYLPWRNENADLLVGYPDFRSHY